jgi:hypothetical protein
MMVQNELDKLGLNVKNQTWRGILDKEIIRRKNNVDKVLSH